MKKREGFIVKAVLISMILIFSIALITSISNRFAKNDMELVKDKVIPEPIVQREDGDISKKVKSNLPKDIMMYKVKQPSSKNEYEAEFLDMLDAREFKRSFKYIGKKQNKTFEEDFQVISDALHSISSKHPEYMGYIGEINTEIESNILSSEITISLIPSLAFEKNKDIGQMLDEFELQAINVIDKLKREGKISESQTEKEKARALYTWVVQNTKYKNNNSVETSSGYGQIVNGEAACQGYVSSYNYLLRLLGIENVKGVAGYVDGQGHIWTEAILDGERTIIDVTFGDPVPDRGDKVDYKYFDINEEEIRKTHIW